MFSAQPSHREIGAALFFTAAMLLGAVLLTALSYQDVRRFDFVDLYTGGLIICQGNGSKLYDLHEQAKVQATVFKRKHVLIYMQPPFEALFWAGLARLSFLRAYVVWGVVNISLWMLFVYLMRPCAPVPRQTFQYFIVCFGFFPLWVALLQGQTSILLLVLYTLTFLSLRRGRDFRAGLFLGLGLFKFPLVLPFALICFLRRKWKLMAGFGLAATMLGGISIAAVGPAGVLSYINLLIETIRHPATMTPWNMPTMRDFFSAVVGGRVAVKWVSATSALVSMVLILFTAWRWWRGDRRGGRGSLSLVFAVALGVSIVTGFHLNTHDLSPMLLPVLLVIGSPQASVKSSWRLLLTVSILILYTPPVYLLLSMWRRMYLLWLCLLTFVVGAFGLLERSSSGESWGDGSTSMNMPESLKTTSRSST